MALRISCPGCGQAYSVKAARLGAAGARFTCQKCGRGLRIDASGQVHAEGVPGATPARPSSQATAEPDAAGVAAPVACPACGHRFVPGAGAALDRPTVLVAEDTPYFRELVRDTLGDRYRTLLVSTKQDALAVLQRERVDLLLLDLSLEDDVDGRDVLRELKSKPCPILIFTARDEEDMYGDVWTELQSLGADDMLIKGMNVEENLLLKVEQLLGKPR